jgi:hypothetical protein
VVLETDFLTPNYTPVGYNPAGLVEGPKNTDLLIADEMPNLQEFAKRKLRRNV